MNGNLALHHWTPMTKLYIVDSAGTAREAGVKESTISRTTSRTGPIGIPGRKIDRHHGTTGKRPEHEGTLSPTFPVSLKQPNLSSPSVSQHPFFPALAP